MQSAGVTLVEATWRIVRALHLEPDDDGQHLAESAVLPHLRRSAQPRGRGAGDVAQLGPVMATRCPFAQPRWDSLLPPQFCELPERRNPMNGIKTMLLCRALAVAAISAILAALAFARQKVPTTGGPMQGMPMHQGMPGKTGTAPPADFKGSSQAFKTVDDGVMQKMDAPLTGDWDWDFVAKMIPHLRGSIDIARVELKHGKDPNLTKLAQDIIAAQQKEIKVMTEWLAQRPK
jgi:hypothetical protein